MPKQGTSCKFDANLFAAFTARVVEHLPRDLDSDFMQSLINNPASLGGILRSAFKQAVPAPASDADDGLGGGIRLDTYYDSGGGGWYR